MQPSSAFEFPATRKKQAQTFFDVIFTNSIPGRPSFFFLACLLINWKYKFFWTLLGFFGFVQRKNFTTKCCDHIKELFMIFTNAVSYFFIYIFPILFFKATSFIFFQLFGSPVFHRFKKSQWCTIWSHWIVRGSSISTVSISTDF